MEQQPETQVETSTTPFSSEAPGPMTTPQTEQPWQDAVKPITDFLTELPEELGKFFADYKQPLITVGLIVAALITVKLTFALIGAINDIPLLAPTFELIGISYTAWFVYRYLLKASDRQDLLAEFDSLKSQVLGKK
ncbi:MAG: CAAD domain-containing protein [Synechococcus sp.]|nr:CAAD domain-containing protein [Synechococcus sp.]